MFRRRNNGTGRKPCVWLKAVVGSCSLCGLRSVGSLTCYLGSAAVNCDRLGAEEDRSDFNEKNCTRGMAGCLIIAFRYSAPINLLPLYFWTTLENILPVNIELEEAH